MNLHQAKQILAGDTLDQKELMRGKQERTAAFLSYWRGNHHEFGVLKGFLLIDAPIDIKENIELCNFLNDLYDSSAIAKRLDELNGRAG